MQLPDMGSEFDNVASLSVWIKLANHTPTEDSRTGFMDFDIAGDDSIYPAASDTFRLIAVS